MGKEKIEWTAVGRKLLSVSRQEKVRLLAKLMLRMVGVNKPLFLGGYSRQEDERQRKQDEDSFLRLSEKQKKGLSADPPESVDFTGDTREIAKLSEADETLLQLLNTDSYIALVTEHLDKGGLEEVVRLLAISLQQRLLRVRVLVLQEGGEIAENLMERRIPVEIFRGDNDRLKRYLASNPPWIVNTHYILDVNALKLLADSPVIEVIHNMYVFQDPAGLELEMVKSAYVNRYIAVSNLVSRVFQKKVPSVKEERICVIGNSLSPGKQLEAGQEQIRETLGIDREIMVFLAVGSVDHRKNQLGLLRAWSVAVRCMEGKAVLLIAGQETEPEYAKKVHRMIEDRELRNTVRLLGYRSDIHDLTKACDVVVLASYYEGWSMAATESLFLGIPIIHADCGSAVELTAGGRCGLLVPGALAGIEDYDRIALYDRMHAGEAENVEQLAEAFLRMAMDRHAWSEKKQDIAVYARKMFSIENMSVRYLQTYLGAYREAHGER